MLNPQAQAGTGTGIQGLAVRDGDPDGPAEDGTLALTVGLLLCAVEDLLEDPGHGEDEGGTERGQRGQDVGQRGAVPEDDASFDAADLDDPGEDMRERKEEQRTGILDGDNRGKRAHEGVADIG